MLKVIGKIPQRAWSLAGQLAAVAIVAGIGALAGCGKGEQANAGVKADPPVQVALGDKKRPDAPDLDGGIAWLNTAQPINLEDLRGRVVLLDFWTLCCINCIHTLPDLAKLEAKYPASLSSSAYTRPSSPTSTAPPASARPSFATRSSTRWSTTPTP